MVTEFLLLMVFLEKTWFTPVGEVLDKRDKALREKLGSVKVIHPIMKVYNDARRPMQTFKNMTFCISLDLHSICTAFAGALNSNSDLWLDSGTEAWLIYCRTIVQSWKACRRRQRR